MSKQTQQLDKLFHKLGLSLEFIRERFNYNPNTGELTYRRNQPPFGKQGKTAVFFNPKIQASLVSLKARSHSASRIIWLYTYGEFPKCQLMFKDGDPQNLKLSNLVEISENPTHLPSQEELKEYLSYDTETGIMLWKKIPYYVRRAKVGDEFGCISIHKEGKYHCKLGVFNKHHKPLTHFIWCYMTGQYPLKGEVIDHIDRNPLNNSWTNLRVVSQQQNSSNQTDRVETKRGLPRGVDKSDDSYYGRCMFKGVLYRGPLRATAEEAHADYIELHKKLHSEFSNYSEKSK